MRIVVRLEPTLNQALQCNAVLKLLKLLKRHLNLLCPLW
jgi:hypothetical protein